MDVPIENVSVESAGDVIVARIRGVPTEEAVVDCQIQVLRLMASTGNHKVVYDALELDSPPIDIALTQQSLTNALKNTTTRTAIVVSSTRVAYLSRLAFGDVDHQVFYNDMAGAIRWLEADSGD